MHSRESRADGTEQGHDAIVGDLPEVALQVGRVLRALLHPVVVQDAVLQVVHLVKQ